MNERELGEGAYEPYYKYKIPFVISNGNKCHEQCPMLSEKRCWCMFFNATIDEYLNSCENCKQFVENIEKANPEFRRTFIKPQEIT